MGVAYCTLSDLEKAVTRRRLLEVTDDDNPTESGTVDPDKVGDAISSAGDVIDSYVGQRYPLPLPSIPDILRRLAVNLAVRDLFARVQDGEMSQGVRDRSKEAISMLADIRDGKISLGLPVTAAAPEAIRPLTNNRQQMFSDRRLSRMDDDIGGSRWP